MKYQGVIFIAGFALTINFNIFRKSFAAKQLV